MNSLFTTERIFNESKINKVCDNITSLLQSSEREFPQTLALGGKAAELLQNAAEESVENIVFVITNFKDYFEVVNNLKTIGVVNIIKYKEVTEFEYYIDGVKYCFEIWYKEDVSITNFQGINILSRNN